MTTKVMKRLMKLEGIQCPVCVEVGLGTYVSRYVNRSLMGALPDVISIMVKERVITPYHGSCILAIVKQYERIKGY